jgi:hypothetical protein
MPWTVKDVDKFKKGLSDKQKRKWVAVANDVLHRCKSNIGDSGTNCEARAIKAANSSISNNNDMEVDVNLFDVLKSAAKSTNYIIREENLDGVHYIVVPVVMMVEGVHNGSKGPTLHQESELSEDTHLWNGIPVTIDHPQVDGQNVSANRPDVFEQYTVGRVFNAHYDNGLKAEAWIDLKSIKEKSPEALDYIQARKPLEVSVGVFNDTEAIEGEWYGETYESIASNYRPDHLALLPDEHGACSWDDGCGIRANKEGGDMTKDLVEVFKDLNQKGYAISPITNEQGYRELTEILQTKLFALDNERYSYYLQEVYNDSFVYAVHSRERGDTTLYKRGYSMKDNEIVWDETPVEVRKKTEYVAMSSSMVRTKMSVNKKGGDMSDSSNLCCEAKVDALIANKQTKWTAADRDWLLTQEESVIEKMSPMESKAEPKVEPQVNKTEVIDEFKAGLKTIDDYTAIMPEKMKARIDKWVADEAAEREGLIKTITDNSEKFKKEDLEVLSDDVLKGIAESITESDYSVMGAGGGKPTKGGIEPYVPAEYLEKPGKEDE